jgi:nicotinamidase-related amidase
MPDHTGAFLTVEGEDPLTKFAPLKKEGSVLVVVDFQEKLVSAVHDSASVLDRAVKMVTAAYALEVPVLFTQQYTAGLGPTHAALKALKPDFSHVEKTSFKSFDTPDFLDRLNRLKARTLVFMGIEAHICVLQTALEGLQRGYEVHVLADASGSRNTSNKEIGLDRIRQAGGIVTATELTIYEWIGRSDSDAFRKLLPLLK